MKFLHFISFIACLMVSTAVSADCVEECAAKAGCLPDRRTSASCRDSKATCEVECASEAIKADEDDVLFTGTKFQSGNTVIISGERIAAPLSAFGGGHLRAEDLAPFEKSVVYSKNASGTVSYSKTASHDSFLNHSREEESQETTVTPGLSFSSRKNE